MYLSWPKTVLAIDYLKLRSRKHGLDGTVLQKCFIDWMKAFFFRPHLINKQKRYGVEKRKDLFNKLILNTLLANL